MSETSVLLVLEAPSRSVAKRLMSQVGLRAASPSEILSAALELEGVESVDSQHVYDNSGDWDLEVLIVEPGRYAVIPLPGESGDAE